MNVPGVLKAPRLVLLLALIGSLIALAGGLWDDAWHTERGRDSFFIAPHLAIYGGVSAIGGALAAWVMLAVRRVGRRGVWAHPPLRLAAAAVTMTLVSAPIDNAWHAAFGRDAVIWSPPHLLGIAGTLALAAAMLAELRQRSERWAPGAAVIAGAALVSAAAFTTVEYDTDVPQFPVVWFLPVLAVASAFALALVQEALDRPWAATQTAAVHLVFIASVTLLLLALGFGRPALPLLVVPALVLDLARRRQASAPVSATLFVVTLAVAYWLVRNNSHDGVRFATSDVTLGALMATPAVTTVLALLGWRFSAPPASRTAAVAAAVTLAAAALAGHSEPAQAHDPGQGPDAGTIDLGVRSVERSVHLRALLPSDCRRVDEVAVVARRAGAQRRTTARLEGCRVTADLVVPSVGRWFVYVNWTLAGQRREAWLPLVVGNNVSDAHDARRFAYVSQRQPSSTLKIVAGVVLYAAVLLLLWLAWQVLRSPRLPALDRRFRSSAGASP